MRQSIYFESHELSIEKLIGWGRQFDPFILLNSNNDEQLQRDSYGKFDWLVAAGSIEDLPIEKQLFPELNKFHSEKKDWLFGYMSYDLKNQIERLESKNHDGIDAPLYHFFRPRYILLSKGKTLEIIFDDSKDDKTSVAKMVEQISSVILPDENEQVTNMESHVGLKDYTENFNKIKQHIQQGDIYETNYCIEFFSENSIVDPYHVYLKLNALSPMPFSAFMRTGDITLACASPERYLAKRDKKIISQPIKGTARRGKDEVEDKLIKAKLAADPKEQSENVMIVDMVRNDLSRTAAKGSVHVEELFGIKTFKQLHQMITTVVSEIRDDVHFTEVIAKSFPMGSMTGAPKVSAMNLIEKFETTKRGIFSGSIGYIDPSGDFDFNVIIRSIIYNQKNRYLSYMAGSAITISANAQQEYDECMLKASTMKKVLSHYERA